MFKPVDIKVSFPKLEEKILQYWDKSKIVEKYLVKNNKANKRFSFLDGPITANNPMGVHHGWSRTFKDIWQRFYNMRGFKQRFQNGFDCQGLWVEVEVEKELGIKNKKEIENIVKGDKKKSIAKFVQLCKERVLKYSQIQTEQSKRLGYFMDWDNSYYTMSDENNYMIWYFLRECHRKGWIYKGRESVPWCPRCQTAISQHEILTEDYKQITHDSIILKFPIVGEKNQFLLVWTTTPWTIPANIAVAVDKEIDYCLVEDSAKNFYWIAKDLVEKVFKKKPIKIKKKVKGEQLVGLKYKGPFDHLDAVKTVANDASDKFHLVIATDKQIMPISTQEGTGLVHTAVSAGEEDFKLGKKLGLPLIPVIADNADYLPGLNQFSGKNAKSDPGVILDYLIEREKKEGDCVFEIFPYTHRYPSCWRCKEELVWKVADEWYIAMDRKDYTDVKKRTLRKQMIDVAKKINWIPDFGLEREIDWLTNMHDWLISKKNRYWGLALPIYECSACGHFEVIGSKEELQMRAIAGWDNFFGHSPHKPYIDEVAIECAKCKKEVYRIDDVGNPWLDAGIVSFSTLIDPVTKKISYLTDKKYWRQWFPADFITESFPGQFKNWFYSLIAMSTVLEKRNPFKTVLGFATLLGEDGRPMHKSWGNSIEFHEGADKIGVDVMRWMYISQNPKDNLLFGYKKADEIRRRFILPLWNIYNFFVSYFNIDKMDKAIFKDSLRVRNILDRWILSKLHNLILKTTISLERYDIQTVGLTTENFINDLSVWYVRRSRDRVGVNAKDRDDKKNCYQTLYIILVNLARLMAPLLPFLTEEIYTNLTGEESVHLSSWPTSNKKLINLKLEFEMQEARIIVEQAHAARRKFGIKVRQPLAGMIYYRPKKFSSLIEKLIRDEINLKSLEYKKSDKLFCRFTKKNLIISQDLKEEGEARELIRQIQLFRKKMGCNLTDKVKVILPYWPEKYTDLIASETMAEEIVKGKSLQIKK